MVRSIGKNAVDRVVGLIFPPRILEGARMPSIPIYLRKANYEKITRHAEATEESIGAIINELIQQMN